MRLSRLFAGVGDWRPAGSAEADITSLSFRSDECGPGCLFFCVPGFKRDGHDFAADAVTRGAAALCVQRELDLPVAQAVVPSVREAMGPVAAAFYGEPSSRLLTVGITGTNGKTTSAFLTAHLFDRAGLQAGLMGTVERRIGGRALPAGRTTPEAVDVQRDLAQMLEQGDKALVMEVSSHALDLGRVLGTKYKVIAFTNLSQDHLDYHKTMDDYYAAKRLLFVDGRYATEQQRAVVNIGDPFGRELAAGYPRKRLIGFSTTRERGEWGAPDLEWSDYAVGPEGTSGTLVLRGTALEAARQAGGSGVPSGLGTPGGAVADYALADDATEARIDIATPLVGDFNVENTLTALGIGLAAGLDLRGMLDVLGDFRGVPGRMESVGGGRDFTVLVDYAHSPDSVRNALRTARGFTRGRLIALIGCGGDRDKGKRPLMGREAEAAADLLYVTSDNPRSEDPMAIIAEITAGLVSPERARVVPDRRGAIHEAVAEARAGDVVMILGKGHESGQEFAAETLPFDDREVAREALAALEGEGR